jgi:beta-1,4-N-acetylglucosaminyltransferase
MKKQIFVTVGTGKFDELVKNIDDLGKNKEYVFTIQFGNGEYEPKNCKSFKYEMNLDRYYKKAGLIISHGGAGTIYELLGKNKKIIGVANLKRTDSHQEEILKALSEEGYLIWCKDVKNIKESIAIAKKFKFKRYNIPKCNISEKIVEFIG